MSARSISPAPWQIIPYGDGDSLVICEADANLRICFMATPGTKGQWPKIKANARLIATAPELLQLAEEGLRAMEDDLSGMLESLCLLDDDLQPRRETLEADFIPTVERKEARIAVGKLLLARARGEA